MNPFNSGMSQNQFNWANTIAPPLQNYSGGLPQLDPGSANRTVGASVSVPGIPSLTSLLMKNLLTETPSAVGMAMSPAALEALGSVVPGLVGTEAAAIGTGAVGSALGAETGATALSALAASGF